MIYLDYMATTPLDPRVLTKMQETLQQVFGNAASEHKYGLIAKAAIEQARCQVAATIHGDPQGIIWTSGATEAINLALLGAAHFYQRQGKHIITCTTEHKAVLATCQHLAKQGFTITYLDPEPDGLLDCEKLKHSLRQDTILVSIMHVNNEIGVIQDIAGISNITHQHGALLHVDAAQSIGKVPLDLTATPIDLVSLCAHKVYGPKGIGALYIRPKPQLHLVPQSHGGDQERGLRSGTLATHQIVGMGAAFELANLEDTNRIRVLRDTLWEGIKELPGIQVHGSLQHRVPHNLNVSFNGIDKAILLAALPDIAVSSAAACTQGLFTPSHVLTALGLTRAEASNALRWSLGRFTTAQEINYTIERLSTIIHKLHRG